MTWIFMSSQIAGPSIIFRDLTLINMIPFIDDHNYYVQYYCMFSIQSHVHAFCGLGRAYACKVYIYSTPQFPVAFSQQKIVIAGPTYSK